MQDKIVGKQVCIFYFLKAAKDVRLLFCADRCRIRFEYEKNRGGRTV